MTYALCYNNFMISSKTEDKKQLGIFKIAIPLSWKQNFLYLSIAGIPCYLIYIFLGEYLRFLREGILWIPFFAIYLYLRYKHNKREHPGPLFILIDNEKITIPAIKNINPVEVEHKFESIDKIYFYYTFSRSGTPILSYCELIPEKGSKIRFSTFQIDLKTLKETLSDKGISIFSKNDTRYKNTRYIMAFLVILFLFIFLFFIIPPETRDYLFDYILSGEVVKDYFSRWIEF